MADLGPLDAAIYSKLLNLRFSPPFPYDANGYTSFGGDSSIALLGNGTTQLETLSVFRGFGTYANGGTAYAPYNAQSGFLIANRQPALQLASQVSSNGWATIKSNPSGYSDTSPTVLRRMYPGAFQGGSWRNGATPQNNSMEVTCYVNSVASGYRYFIGYLHNINAQGLAGAATSYQAGVILEPSVSTSWQAVASNGTTATKTSVGAAATANTVYTIKVVWAAGSVAVTVNGTTITVNTNLPTQTNIGSANLFGLVSCATSENPGLIAAAGALSIEQIWQYES